MPLIAPRGSPSARVWIVLDAPYGSDVPRGYLLSGGMGSVFDKMFAEAKLSLSDTYVCARRPDTDTPLGCMVLENTLNHYKPPLVLAIGEAAVYFLPTELSERGASVQLSWGQFQKYAGSMLRSNKLTYDHYMIPIYGPDRCIADWTERNVTTYVDLQKVQDELVWWKQHGVLKPLPERKLVYGNLELDEILHSFNRFRNSKLLSVDIETVYPRTGSAFLPHPGYPITIGIADSANYGISFNLFRENPKENNILWRTLDNLFRDTWILGQNFFNFDSLFIESLGFTINLTKVQDTLVRHHILWPELSHKLQFMTRQYTREPYYKDEGHGWSVKHMDRLRRYNCLDVCVTYEIYEAQEKEFDDRPHLR